MSAWRVSWGHIAAIVTTSVKGYASDEDGSLRTWADTVGPAPLSEAEATAMGQTLWNANYHSVNVRYGETLRAPRFHYSDRGRILTIAELAKAIHCLDYQSCEYAAWDGSKARRFLDKVERAGWMAISHTLPGYHEAPWGID